MDDTKTFVIVGGGFAGTTLARELDTRLPKGYERVLISEESYTTFNPMLPEAPCTGRVARWRPSAT